MTHHHLRLTTNMLSSVIKGGLHTYSLFSSLFTMLGPNKDIFATLLSPTVRNDIASFVGSHYQFAILSHEPLFSLQSRFIVTVVGLNKAVMPTQHESIAIWVLDKDTLKTHEFIIERVPGLSLDCSSRFSLFSQFAAIQRVLDSIQCAINNMLSISASESTQTEMDSIPLLPLTNGPHDHSSTPSLTPTTPLSLTDTITSSLARAVAAARVGSQSISPQRVAEDSISGCLPQTILQKDCIRLFHPMGLSLFNVVLLAQVVHEYAPIYGLFDNQCYMFASVIFDAVVDLFSHSSSPPSILDPNHCTSTSSTSSMPVPAPTPEFGAPKNANLIILPSPEDRAGHWFGLLILDPIVKATMVSIIKDRFEAQRNLYMSGMARAL